MRSSLLAPACLLAIRIFCMVCAKQLRRSWGRLRSHFLAVLPAVVLDRVR